MEPLYCIEHNIEKLSKTDLGRSKDKQCDLRPAKGTQWAENAAHWVHEH